jgi:hypothetical protein
VDVLQGAKVSLGPCFTKECVWNLAFIKKEMAYICLNGFLSFLLAQTFISGDTSDFADGLLQ